jgi:hypothetical protein
MGLLPAELEYTERLTAYNAKAAAAAAAADGDAPPHAPQVYKRIYIYIYIYSIVPALLLLLFAATGRAGVCTPAIDDL